MEAQNTSIRGRDMGGKHPFRPTMDIDMLGITNNEEASIIAQIRDITTVDVEPDGLTFDPESIQTERITEDADYEGIRVRFRGMLDSARVSMQVDIGFGDIIYPGPEQSELPTMLNSPAPRLLCYSRESAIAEKFEAMVKLGMLNSRMEGFLRHMASLPSVRFRQGEVGRGDPVDFRTEGDGAPCRSRGI
jgi:hypothetical protein